AFDNGYDLAIILTKNSNALARQTVARMQQEFTAFKDDDIVDIFDIMCIPQELSRFELDKKLIIVVKKEKNNLPKMIDFIEKYSLGSQKKCLIIDDEADFCSIGFEINKETDEYDLRTIASQINSLREHITCNFIQVTATPYALYLQPETIELKHDDKIVPIKPADTVLVPYGDKYIGGDYYFDTEKNPLNKFLFYAINEEELTIIKSQDRRKFKTETVLTNKRVEGLRTAIINFIVAGCIRIIQNGGQPRGKQNKFSFIIHTEIAKAAHQNQENIINELFEQIKEEVTGNTELIQCYVRESYDGFKKSILAYTEKYPEEGFVVPDYAKVKEYFYRAIEEEWVCKSIVNSEIDINTMLDDEGQLKLRNPLNIFIGGQILDRGITIANLIGFYYGRSPKKMQQDSVLQHARMYGYRKLKDLAVTKFYTTPDLYLRMRQINEFDRELRSDIEQGNFDDGVIFIGQDSSGRIVPCSPNKILISNTRVLKAGSTALPVGFNTGYKTNIQKYVNEIDKVLQKCNHGVITGQYELTQEDALEIIFLVYKTLELEIEDCLKAEELASMIKYLSKDSHKVKIYCVENRNISRFKADSKYYSDAPYTGSSDLKLARDMAISEPTLMLIKQNGKSELGWRDAEFYWPVLVVQQNVKAAVYTSDLL
ncbi:MAG: hypothetical protein KA965_10655, partial [Butyrivibrio sp.]|nr:hypothetical protein [Butyrivibrio sp.]